MFSFLAWPRSRSLHIGWPPETCCPKEPVYHIMIPPRWHHLLKYRFQQHLRNFIQPKIPWIFLTQRKHHLLSRFSHFRIPATNEVRLLSFWRKYGFTHLTERSYQYITCYVAWRTSVLLCQIICTAWFSPSSLFPSPVSVSLRLSSFLLCYSLIRRVGTQKTETSNEPKRSPRSYCMLIHVRNTAVYGA